MVKQLFRVYHERESLSLEALYFQSSSSERNILFTENKTKQNRVQNSAYNMPPSVFSNVYKVVSPYPCGYVPRPPLDA